MHPSTKRVLWYLGGGMTVMALGCASLFVCLPAWLQYGIVVNECPAGDVHQTLEAQVSNLGRAQNGSVTMSADAWYTIGRADEARGAAIRRLSADLALVDPEGKETPLRPLDGWDDVGDAITCQVDLPDVPDGDYKLRVRADTAVGEDSLDVPLPLYAPARIHVLTDRPLYEPGNTVQFRALALRARDLSPLDGRPGTFTVTDPNGEVVLEEKAPAGPWGVSASSFPLDRGAPSGDWVARWTSGEASGEASFRVEPFTLPRFRVDVTPDKPSYGPGDLPVVRGRVVYSSGAPVAGASVALRWEVGGDWPAPTAWQGTGPGALPEQVSTDASGAFVLQLPRIPGDLQGQATLGLTLDATDPAGDHVASRAALLLSEDPILVSTVTEAQDGLIEKVNNRLYLRATTPWGTPLAGARLRVARAWDAADPGVLVQTDEDGVASLQIDPGPAVNVVVPARPVRLPPPPDPVERTGATDRLGGDLTLDDQVLLDTWNAALAPCARLSEGTEASLSLSVAVGASGAVRAVAGGDSALARCAADVLRRQRLAAGDERLLVLDYQLHAPDQPTLDLEVVEAGSSTPSDLVRQVQQGLILARTCLPPFGAEGGLPRLLAWQTAKGSRKVSATWVPDPDADEVSASAAACVERIVSGQIQGEILTGPADEALGALRFSVQAPIRAREAAPQPTTMLGYEFRVTATQGERELGSTLLRMPPGSTPALRIRATPVIAKPGDKVEFEFFRGPSYSGDLPEEVTLSNPLKGGVALKIDRDTRKATYTLPADATGWYTVETYGAVSRVYVPPTADLSVALSADQARYAPGQSAKLTVRTTSGGAPVAAGVTLSGVDESLGQLVPLPGAGALDPMQPQVQTSQAAFGALDGQALAMGRVRGANAAAAVLLRISQVPTPADLDQAVYSHASGTFTPLEALTDHFYIALTELHVVARAWEEKAGQNEKMTPPVLAKLWEQALDRCEARGEPVTDAYGRRLRLRWLPPDLLALTDPREVVTDGTRLPEDIENWAQWVAREQP